MKNQLTSPFAVASARNFTSHALVPHRMLSLMPSSKLTWSLVTAFMFLIGGVNNSWGQLLQWNTFGNLGSETAEPSVFNATGIQSANLSLGAGVTPAGNGNRFGGNDWFDTGNTNPTSLAESVADNDYIEFTVTPDVGYMYTPTSFVFNWDHSATGPYDVTLRSSNDGFVSDIGSVFDMPVSISTGNVITISGLINLSGPTTFRLYGYDATGTTGSGGFDVASNVVNVALLGTSNCKVRNVTSSLYYCTLQAAIDAASPNDNLELLANITEGLIVIDETLSIDGNGFTINSTSPTYGINPAATGISITDLTLQDAGTYGIQTDCGADFLLLTNVTVNSSGNSGISIYGSDNCTLNNVTSTNNGGNGVNITNSDNTTITGITTSGNTFGSFSAGIGLFTSGTYCLPAGLNGFTLGGTVSIAEVTKVYSQKANAADPIIGVSGATIDWAVGIAALDRSYWPDKGTAYAVVDALFEPPYNYPNTVIYVADVMTEHFYVEDDPAGDATPPMLIQAAVTYEVPGKTIFLESGTFSERVILNKSLTLDGDGAGLSILDGTGLAGNGNGITLNTGITNVTIKDLSVRDYAGSNPNSNAGIYGTAGNNNLTITDVDLADNIGGSGFYANGPIDNVLMNNVDAHGHTAINGAARGIVFWNGHKSNITITNCEVYSNNCCGIELQDGSSSAINISDNNIHDNWDNGIGIVGLNGTTGANLIDDNTLTNNGRFGIEIKNPNGNGTNTVISNNDVTQSASFVSLRPLEVRDIAGIAVMRRGVLGSNVDVPNGVQVINNTVSGYVQDNGSSVSEGFGIVIEGTNHTATGNTISSNDIGLQQQAGHTPYPGDGDQNNLADMFFGRANSPMTCGNTVTPNTYASNGSNTRNMGVGAGLVVNTNTSENFCSIQSAINDANTLAGHTISVSAGTFNEDVLINKDLTLQGAGIDVTTVKGPIGGGSATFQVGASGVTIDGFTITRDGNNTIDWNNASLNSPGIAIQGLTVNAEIRNNKITGNRTGIDINNSNGNNVHNNIITFNRTGAIFRNQTNNTLFNENFVTDNWTVGIVFLDASSGSNVPLQQSLNCSFNDNDISANWYGEIVDRQTGGALPLPGANPKDFECNWYGTVTPWVSTANSTEPGYAAQIPVAYGGSAVPPGGQPDILGPASANFDYINYLLDGTDNLPLVSGFQPVGACTGMPVVVTSAVLSNQTCTGLGSIQVTFSGGVGPYDIAWTGGSDVSITSPYTITGLTAGAYGITVTDDNGTTATSSATILYQPVTNTNLSASYATIQAAIDAASAGHVIEVCAGTYAEHLIINKSLDIRGPNYGISGTGIRVAEAVIVPEANFMPADPWTEVVFINANNVSFDGFKVSGDNPGISGYAYAGMNLEKGQCVYSEGNDVTFRNNIVEKATTMGFFAGGYLPSPTFTNLILTNNKFESIQDLNQLGYGFAMYVQATAGAITNNTVLNSRTGIQVQPYRVVQGTNGASVCSNNTFSIWRQGVYYNYAEVGASAWTINANTITATSPPAAPTGPVLWAGISAETMRATGNGGTISNNQVDGSGAVADAINWWGVWGLDYRGTASTSIQVNFTGNTVSNVGLGLVHSAAADIVVTGNTLSATNQAISIQRNFNSAGVMQADGGINNINATGGNTIDGVPTVGASYAQLFAIENKVNHKIDWKTLGFVTINSNTAYVTDINAGQSTTNNDYTRIRNAVEHAGNNWSINLNGSFDWTETNAAASWVLGNDGVAATGDDYGILVPANLNGITFTAPLGLGAASIQGPGDVPTIDLEGVLYCDGAGDNQNWTISNIEFLNFDLPVSMFNGAGGADAYNGTTITNNRFDIATDLNAIDAPGDALQNIGIHYSFGTNQTISNNTFNVPGDGVSNGVNFSTTVVMQSNTSGGSVYNGLLITGNTINILNAQSANPQVVLGIWDNGHAHTSNITVSNNQFNNLAGGNNPLLNLQRAFRVTSHSGAGSTVTYSGNTVQGANIGFQWISGNNFAAHMPVVMTGNFLNSNNIGMLLQSNGKALLTSNSFDGATDNNRDVQIQSGSTVTSGGSNQWAGEGYYVENLSANALNITGETFDQVNQYRRTDRMYGALDNPASGLIRFDGNNLYVSAPGTGLADETIPNAISAAAPSGDFVHIETGSYATGLNATSKEISVVPGASPGCVTLGGDLILTGGDVLAMEINGTTPCSTHDQLIVNGTVTLGGANLSATLGYGPVNGDQIVIIDNDGADAVIGQFAQGSSVNLGGNYFLINYAGGSGNDVVLTMCAGVQNTTTLEVFCTIQEGIDDAQTINGHTLAIAGGTYNERVTLTKQLTLDGAGSGLTILDGTGLAGSGNGITLNTGITNVTIKDLTVRDYAGANPNSNAGIYGIGGNNNLTVTDVDLADNIGGSGFYANGPINNVLMNNVDAHGHTNINGAARGIVIWNGHKSNITITNCEVYNNNCCGIELQDGSASGVTMANNNVHDNWDNGIGIVGLDGTTAPNLVNANTLTNNGRFGIEIKNPNGNGTNTVISNNNVTQGASFFSLRPAEVRDIAGIAVFRRGVTGSNVDVPTGVRVINNNVSGYIQDNGSSVSEGFGIVIEGTNHTATGNTINNNDIGLQQQAGHTPYPGDGNQNNNADTYFGRGNSPMTCGNTVAPNTYAGNGANTRNVLVGGGLVTNTNTSETFCSIQSAIDDANTLNGHTLSIGVGTYNENVNITKSLTLIGSGNSSNPVTNTVLTPSSACGGIGFTISAANVTIQNMYVTNYQDAVLVNGVVNPTINKMSLVDYCRYGVNFGGSLSTSVYINNTTIQRTSYLINTIGIRTGTANGVDDMLIDTCTITGNMQGSFIAQSTTPSVFNNIIIRNSTISNNLQKGLYFEKLSNAVLSNLTMNNNGTDPTYGFNNGIDINLKYSNYSNITIEDCDITNSGVNGIATDPQNVAAIAIKARDDSPSYNSIPASLTSVSLTNNRISGPQNGIRFGEFGKINNTPSNVLMEGNDLSFAFAHKAVIRRTNDDVNMLCNWHGSTSLPVILATFAEAGTGSTILSSILLTGVDGNPAVGFQPSGTCGCPSGNLVTNTNTPETFCTLQAAINDPDTDAGDVLVVGPGTYIENIVLNKDLDLRGNNYNINPNTGVRGPESIIVPATSDPDPNSLTAVNIMYLTAAATGSVIDGFIIDGDNPSLTSVVNINGANIDAIECIAGYDGTSNLTISNNILRNVTYAGIDMYNYYNSGAVTSDNYIWNNKIDNVAQSPYGVGIIIYNNFYASIAQNVMTRVRVGVQTGNFYSANTGATNSISSNAIQAERRGIFHNLAYGSASPLTIGGNTITTVPGALNHLGISLSAIGGTVGATIANNNIDGAYAGVDFWSCTSTPALTVSGGMITNCNYGVVASNFDGYNSNANSSAVRMSGVSITGSTVAAVHVKDNPSNSNGATINLTVDSDCEINGTSQLLTGILVSGPQASATVQGNDASINGFAIGIDVDGGSATITNNHIYDNGIGVRFTNSGFGTVHTNRFQDALPNGKDIQSTLSGGAVIATPNNWFAGTTFGVENLSSLSLDATASYWNNASGPGPVGPGGGANITTNVLYCPWLDAVPVALGGPGPDVLSSPTVTIAISETSGLANNDGTICEGAFVLIDATTAGAVSYLWSSGQTTASINVAPAVSTVYTVTVTFAGCTDDAMVTITVGPLPIVSGPSAVCVGSTIQMLPSSGGTWTSNNPLLATIGLNTGLVTGVAAGGPVTFTFTQTSTGCSNSTGPVMVNPVPSAVITAPEFVWENTAGYAASVPNAGGGATYVWTASSGSITSGTAAVTFTSGSAPTMMINVTVTDANGCSSTGTFTVNVLPACLTIDFDDPVLLSNTQQLGYWYTDRYNPFGFVAQTAAPDATPNTLKVSINAADGQVSGFYNTQGRKHDLIDGTQAIQAQLFVAAGWASTNRRMAGMWGTAFDAGNAPSAYPIIEYTSDGGVPRFRVWESGSGVYVDLGLPPGFLYNQWVTLRAQLLPSGEFLFSVLTAQGDLQYTTTTSAPDASIDILNVILQGHNTTAGVTYDIYWNNFQSTTILTPDITAANAVCKNSTGNLASVTMYGGASYAWSVDGGSISSGQGTPNIVYTAGMGSQLTLHCTVSTADCEATTSHIVVLNPLPVATITTPPSVAAGMPGNPATIPDAGGGATYVWSITNGTITGGQGTSSMTYTAGVPGPLTINVTVTNSFGCSSVGSIVVTVIAVGPSTFAWVPDNGAHGTCPATTNCCTDVICYGLQYTPGVSGNLTTYTTGFMTECLGNIPLGITPIISNQSCIMTDNSFELNACSTIDSILFNSSGNGGLVPVMVGVPIITHKVCFQLSAGVSLGIVEDVITNLSASVDLTGGGQYTEFPSYASPTIVSKPLPVIPAPGMQTVSCPTLAVLPTPPTVLDYCGNPVPVTLLTTVDAPNPVICEGTRTYSYNYTDCAGVTYPWSFTYTIDDNINPTASNPMPILVESFIDIPPPDITVVTDEADNCGGTPVVTHYDTDIIGLVCDGAYLVGTRTYRVTDCAGNFSDVTQIIIVEDITDPTGSNPLSISVDCFSDVPMPDVNVVTSELDNTDDAPIVAFIEDNITSVLCDGAGVTVTRTYRISDCAGNSIDVFQTINVDDITNPTANNLPTTGVQCFSDIPLPNVNVVTNEADNCDGAPIVTYVGDDIDSTMCDGGTLIVTRTYQVTDCSGNFILVTQTFNVDDTTPPAEVGGPVSISSTVGCPLDAVAPHLSGAPDMPVIEDICGNVLVPPAPVQGGTWTNGCTGTITFTYTYTSCSGIPFVWVYTYTVDCDPLTLKVLLEGSYVAGSGTMNNDLNDNHLLPGQDKLLSPSLAIQLGAPFTPFGQPYNSAPWNYNGNSGLNFGDASSPSPPPGVIVPYPLDVVDWVLVTVRKNGLLPAQNHWTCAGWVHQDGEVTFPESCGTLTLNGADNYYVMIQHRNHLGVLSPIPALEPCSGYVIDWDFTSGNSYQPTFRYGQKMVDTGIWAMHAANGEQITSIPAISSPDRTIWRLLQGVIGYSVGDFNMNSVVTPPDETIWKTNQNKTSGVIFY